MSAPWTDAHQREALRRTYEIAAEAVSHVAALSAMPRIMIRVWSEAAWCEWCADAGLDATRIIRELRRVRDIAEGRRRWVETWRVRYDGKCHDSYTVDLSRKKARATLKRMSIDAGWTGAVVRVRRLVRAT